ncbi:MAG: acetate/propionate family kinase, partial [Coxiellaceae bacterium]|nr:acetate/propionate family kinase [Coxiellaceae bacterium]
MYILVLNCGSSSIKYAVIAPQTAETALDGLIEIQDRNYNEGLQKVKTALTEQPEISNSIIGIGHRVVHGGEAFKASVVITETVLEQIKACIPLAPLHNPANLLGIEFMKANFPKLPNVAVFDTAFHQTMPKEAFIYAIPYELYEKHNIRRYGFHGTSHAYVTQQAANLLNKPYEECAFVSAHLGNGCSACAVLNGKSIDTTMGLTPLEGLVMGTRSGDIDPGVLIFLEKELGYDAEKLDTLL